MTEPDIRRENTLRHAAEAKGLSVSWSNENGTVPTRFHFHDPDVARPELLTSFASIEEAEQFVENYAG